MLHGNIRNLSVACRHEKSGELGDPGSQKILQIAEDSNEQKNVQTSK